MTPRSLIANAVRDWLFDSGDNRANVICSRIALVLIGVLTLIVVGVEVVR